MVCVALALDDPDVLRDADAVAEAQGPAVDQGAADAVEAVGLARVDGDREELAGQQVERRAVVAGREARLGPGDVEADDARSRWRTAS